MGMKDGKLEKLYERLCLTSVFIGVTEKPLYKAFSAYINAGDGYEKRKAYASFVARVYQNGGNLFACVQKEIFEDENAYIKAVAHKKTTPACVEQSVKRELSAFSAFASLTVKDFAEDLGVLEEELPSFDSFDDDLYERYQARLRGIDKYGYGIFSSQGMFRLSDDKQIEPIVSADKIGMDNFIGYEDERAKVVANTKAFVEGRPAANTLLCGDAGTGKSSTVKAVANAFFDKGVRLIELRKDQLALLPLVMGKISGNPLKFIIFIDDLSFNQNDDNFSMLKAALEGSASAKAENAVIYATSNRRHIVKESFADREGDDVHINDTLQETLSLSERFGLVVSFSKPSKALYLEIVKQLAEKYGVKTDETQLFIQAEAFALKKGSRSARCAEQFIDSLL
ncbi:MAG: ATP-binding protein [Clostridiales bacterium]|nr:ATP-binding protein [Clostridiales bacterium]